MLSDIFPSMEYFPTPSRTFRNVSPLDAAVVVVVVLAMVVSVGPRKPRLLACSLGASGNEAITKRILSKSRVELPPQRRNLHMAAKSHGADISREPYASRPHQPKYGHGVTPESSSNQSTMTTSTCDSQLDMQSLDDNPHPGDHHHRAVLLLRPAHADDRREMTAPRPPRINLDDVSLPRPLGKLLMI